MGHSHGHSHSHAHRHSHGTGANERRLIIVVVIAWSLVIFQLARAWLTGSPAADEELRHLH